MRRIIPIRQHRLNAKLLRQQRLFVDYCGHTVSVIDPATGEERQAKTS